MDFYFNSQDEKCKKPFGAVNPGAEVDICIYCPGDCSGVTLRAAGMSGYECSVPMEKGEGGVFTATLTMPSEPGLVFYCFVLSLEDGSVYYYGNGEDRLGGEGRIYAEDPVPYQITVYESSSVPEWYKNAVVYQIFPTDSQTMSIRRKNIRNAGMKLLPTKETRTERSYGSSTGVRSKG